MKATLIIFLLFVILITPSYSQEASAPLLEDFITHDHLESKAKFDGLLEKLSKKKSTKKNDRDFVRLIFIKTHHDLLKRYKEYTPFDDILTQGNYNCLTGTILYSLILSHFNIKHEIIETNYHIFLLVNTDQGKILIESTDPLHGFVTSQEEVSRRIDGYKSKTQPIATSSDKVYYQFHFNLYRHVSKHELLGLMLYNLSVETYNNQQLEDAVKLLSKASESYHSERIEEFSRILLLAIHQSDLEDAAKLEYSKKLQQVRHRSMPVIASLSN